MLDKFGKLGQMEPSDVNLLVLETFERLLNEHFAMSIIFKEVHHVDDDLRVDRLKIALQLLH